MKLAHCGPLSVLIIAPLAHADLLGSTIHIPAYYPDASTIYFDPGERLVEDPGVEYPQGTYKTYNPSWEVDVNDAQIIITDATSSGLPFGGGVAFNGWIAEVTDGAPIVSASIDPASTIVPFDVYVEDNRLHMNFAGVSQQVGGSAIINVVTESACIADCNGDGQLNILDFVCFQSLFQKGGDGADCNGDGQLNILDFVCFQGAFQKGC